MNAFAAIIKKTKSISFEYKIQNTNTILFNELSDGLINAYIASGSPMDKAGAYGVQDNEQFPLVKKTSGSNNNIIGFPTEQILEDLKNFNY